MSDAVYSDYDYDGYADAVDGTISLDLDGDGFDESWAWDTNHDGAWDISAIDADGDGTFEAASFDLDGDGALDDAGWVDSNEDGVPESQIAVPGLIVPTDPVDVGLNDLVTSQLFSIEGVDHTFGGV